MWGQSPLFGDSAPSDNILGVPPLRLPVAPIAAAVQAKPQSHAFLREGGPGRTIIGIIADALAGATGGTPMYSALMLKKREYDLEQKKAADEAARKLNEPIRTEVGGDYIQYDPATKSTQVLYHGQTKASEPYRWRGNNGDLLQMGPDGQPQVVYHDPTPKVDYIEATDPTTGAKSLIPRTVGGAAAPPTPGTVKNGYRFKGGNPADPASWEAVGGPTPPASGTFR
jgi:hypothetical protein